MNKTKIAIRTITAITGLLLSINAFMPNLKDSVLFYFNTGKKAEQLERWQTNYECVRDEEIKTFTNDSGIEIGVKVCRTGVIFVRAIVPTQRSPLNYFVSPIDLFPDNEIVLSAFPEVHADYRTQIASGIYKIICQRWIDNENLKQRIFYNGILYDVVIYAPTGQEIYSERYYGPADCNYF